MHTTESTTTATPTAPTTSPALLTQAARTDPTALATLLTQAARTDPNALAALLTQATPADPNTLAALLAEAAPTIDVLDELEFDGLSPAGRVDAVVACERSVRHAQARLIRRLGPLAREAQDTDSGWLVESELCAALAWSPTAVQTRLAEADALTRLFPDTLQQLAEGRIALEQARCLAQLTYGLDDDAAQAVEARVLPRMPGQSASVTRQAVRRAVLRADPHAAEQRHAHERKRRRVELIPEDDGMATLNFYLPADIAQMAMRTLTTLAQSAKRKNRSDGRTLDQLRADLLPALLNGANGITDATAAARVTVVVGVETLLGLSHEPGHLDGHGPITPEHTRTIANANSSRWRFLLTSTDGTPVHTSPTYTPRAALAHLTRLQHTTCAFPHCRMPADRCDLDHNQPHADGGPTALDNLAPLCRRHHNHKTRGLWKLTRTDDTITWTSNRTGRTYTTTPTRYQPTPTTA